MKTRIDLNSDMGEGFGHWIIGDGVDEQLMPLITSANIATGFHAGDPNIMHKMVMLAKQHKVGIGAHPGFHDLVGFGRRHITASAEELCNDIVYQLGALREFTRLVGAPLQHVKPHGALYMHAYRDEALSRAFVQAIHTIEPSLIVFCMPGSSTYRVCQEIGQPVVREFYGDRDYDKTGAIVLVRHMNALDPDAVADKVLRACMDGVVQTIDGEEIAVDFDSICIHSDTPGALALIQTTRKKLEANGIRITHVTELI
ncbi:5-oxoprolinase subunit PxpA [Bordetella sp. FB-8]|uniref:5-oxoprolinase subunit PxpA n=1 Tax=Bordetella sp. FB-8 TaxID=1159870 RepID=UPI000363809E|nr:5-oxoprolinase subunit PxpA [Bordetella sp. FB-8]